VITFPLGVYKTRAEAEEAAKLWSDIYPAEAFDIVLVGSLYRLDVTLPDDPR
jgi:hypothetical protein